MVYTDFLTLFCCLFGFSILFMKLREHRRFINQTSQNMSQILGTVLVQLDSMYSLQLLLNSPLHHRKDLAELSDDDCRAVLIDTFIEEVRMVVKESGGDVESPVVLDRVNHLLTTTVYEGLVST